MIVALMAVGLVACTTEPAPAPLPTPSALSSEDAAFAAAEATYRAYVDALNRVDLADPSTFEPVWHWLRGTARRDSHASLDRLHSADLSVSGASVMTGFKGVGSGDSAVTAEVCLDVSQVEVRRTNGESAADPDRIDFQPLLVTFSPAETSTGMAIAESEAIASEICG